MFYEICDRRQHTPAPVLSAFFARLRRERKKMFADVYRDTRIICSEFARSRYNHARYLTLMAVARVADFRSIKRYKNDNNNNNKDTQ